MLQENIMSNKVEVTSELAQKLDKLRTNIDWTFTFVCRLFVDLTLTSSEHEDLVYIA